MDPSSVILTSSTPDLSISLIVKILFLFFLVFLSAFFSSAETAFSTANKIRIKSLADEGSKRAACVIKILENYGKLISTILIGNNIVNLSASALATTIAISLSTQATQSLFTGISTAILTVLILLYGEIIPKTWANLNADKISLFYAPIIRFLMIILTPVIGIVNLLSNTILKIFRIDPNKKNATITESELKTYLDAGHEEGVIEEEEREMIYNVFDFGDSLAKDVMIPRIDMVSVEDTASYDDIKTIFKENMYTRLPVYHDSTDNIVGIINIKDFLFVSNPKEFRIADILRDVHFTYEYKKTSDLLLEMRQSSANITMVLNEYGSTEGMITLEDLLEEIVGEIRDEYDEDEEQLIQTIADNIYVVPGGMKLDDINNSLDTNFYSEDYDSIGGLIIEKLDKLPAEGEFVTLEDATILTVERIIQNRIELVKVELTPPVDESENTVDTEQ